MNYWKIVNRILDESDIILEIIDARLIHESRNPEIEKKAKERNKRIIYVINKMDLVKDSSLKNKLTDLYPSARLSSKKKIGTTRLKKLILGLAKENDVTVGVLGYPNTGKSSVINALKGKRAAQTSPISGYTKGIQKVRISKKIMLIDTPGVIPFNEKDEFKHAMIGTKSVNQIRDIEYVALMFIENEKRLLESHFGMLLPDDPEEALENISRKLNLLKKGGEPDLQRASKRLIDDWQKGKINLL